MIHPAYTIPLQENSDKVLSANPILYKRKQNKQTRCFWWRQRSRLEKSLILLLIVSLTVYGVLSFVMALFLNKSPGICLTKICTRLADQLIKNMDESVDPCDNFYKFACGGFVNETFIPDDKMSMYSLSMLNDKLEERMNTILKNESNEFENKKFFTLPTQLYKSCIDRKEIEKQGLEPAKQMLNELGGWPVLDKPDSNFTWNPANFTWTGVMYHFRQLGLSTNMIMDVSIIPDLKNTSENRIILEPPKTFGLSMKHLRASNNTFEMKTYLNYLINVAVLFGADAKNAENEMQKVLSIEQDIAFILGINGSKSDIYEVPISALEDILNKIPLLDYIRNLFCDANGSPNMAIDSNERIIFRNEHYLFYINHWLGKVDKRNLANFILFRGLDQMAGKLNRAMRSLKLDLQSALNGQKELMHRSKSCTKITIKSLPHAAGSLYIRHYFKNSDRQAAQEMWRDIRKSFISMLQDLPWMDEDTRERALQKVHKMRSYIGYPDELLDDLELEKFYEGLDLDPKLYIKNYFKIQKFTMDQDAASLRSRINRTAWTSHSNVAIVNAFYEMLENSVMIPAGILQTPLFGKLWPKFSNYGSIGWILGHELTHGFDNIGCQFDEDGHVNNWWANTTKARYNQKVKCIINQYGNYSLVELNGLKINGRLTQGENIADNGGLKAASRAYRDWIERNQEEEQLPGLKYSARQLFWISAAGVWCNLFRPQALLAQISLDPHSPMKFRVKGPISNMDEFSKDFQCPKGSQMNRLDKCSVW